MLRHFLMLTALLWFAIPTEALAAKLASVQRGTFSLPALDSSATVELTAVDLSKSILLFDFQGDTDKPAQGALRAQLTADDTITFSRGGSGAYLRISWTVLEFQADVKVQRGTHTGSDSVTLPEEVDPTKSFVITSMSTTDGGVWGPNHFVLSELESATLLRLRSRDLSPTVDWQVIEYQDASVQRHRRRLAYGGGSDRLVSPDEVPKDKSIVLFSGYFPGTQSFTNGQLFFNGRFELDPRYTTAKYILISTGVSGLVPFEYSWEVVTFTDDTFVQQGFLELGPQRTNVTLTLSPIIATSAAVISSGRFTTSSSTTSSNIKLNALRTELSDTRQTWTRSGAGVNMVVSWQVVEFERVGSVDVGVEQAASHNIALLDQPVTHTIDVTNHSATDVANNVVVTSPQPDASTFSSVSGVDWDCVEEGGDVTCTLPSLAPQTSAAPIALVRKRSSEGTLTNVVAVATDAADPFPSNNGASTSTLVFDRPVFGFGIDGSPNPVAAGAAKIDWGYWVWNQGTIDATNVTIIQKLAPGTEYLSSSGADWTCLENAAEVSCTSPYMAADSVLHDELIVSTTVPDEAGVVTSTATISADQESLSALNPVSSSVSVIARADLSIGLDATPSPVLAGGTLSYVATVHNSGPSTASALTATFALPAGTSFDSGSQNTAPWVCSKVSGTLSCTLGSLAKNEDSAINLDVLVTAADGSVTLSGSVSADEMDPRTSNNSATLSTIVTPAADLALSVNAPSTGRVGETIAWSFQTLNGGPSSATSLSLSVELPDNIDYSGFTGLDWECAANGQTITCTAMLLASQASSTVTVKGVPTASGTRDATASLGSAVLDPDTSDNAWNGSMVIADSADLSLTATGPSTAIAPGDEVTYTLTLRNNGLYSSASSIQLDAATPVGASFISATGESGRTWDCDFTPSLHCALLESLAPETETTVAVKLKAPASYGDFDTTFEIGATEHDAVLANNAVTVTTTVNSAELKLSANAPETAFVGEALSYAFTVENRGPAAATAVELLAELPTTVTSVSATGTDWTCLVNGGVVACLRSLLASGGSSLVTVNLNAPTSPGSIDFVAATSSTTPDSDQTDNSVTVETEVLSAADLALTATASTQPVAAGADVTLALEARNAGISRANAVTVTGTLAGGSSFVSSSGSGWLCEATSAVMLCTLSEGLDAGSTSPLQVVLSAPDDAGPFDTTFVIAGTEHDPVTGNNRVTTTVTVTSADLSLAMVAAAESVLAGNELSFDVTVTNGGPSSATGVVVTAAVPPGTSFVAAMHRDWACGVSDDTVVCLLSSALGPRDSSTVSLTFIAPNEPTSVQASASVTAEELDPVGSNNTASATVGVGAKADLGIALNPAAGSVPAGGALTLTCEVSNHGPSTAHEVTVTLPLPSGVGFASARGAGWACSNTSDSVVCELANAVAAGSSSTTLTTVFTASSVGGTVDFTATVDSAADDPIAKNNVVTTSVLITPVSDISIELGGAPLLAARGAPVTFFADVTNHGPSNAADVEVTVSLSEGLVFRDARGVGWSCTAVAPVVCAKGALTVEETSSLQIDATTPTTVGPVTVQATVAGLHPDPDSTNDTAEATLNIGAPALDNPATTLTVSPSGPAVGGTTLTYALTLSNNGNWSATGVEASIALPAGTSLAEGGTLAQPFVLGDIEPGDTKTASFAVRIRSDHAGSIDATAIVSADNLEPFERSVSTPVLEKQPLDLSLVATPDTLLPGASSTLVFNIGGGQLQAGGVLEVVLPAGLELVAGSVKLGTSTPVVELSDGKARIRLPEIDGVGLTAEMKVLASTNAVGTRHVTATVFDDNEPRSLEASVMLEIQGAPETPDEDEDSLANDDGCGCGSSGGGAASTGLLMMFALATLGRRRTSR